ncbi:hypothetical protein [Streptococcus equi]|uniref:hypothetical protein n=1 Tax=Streptococcus equi TaxID=1336 RepID=UPI001E595974|nr:hypothetical protein [Streptococcus equi]
MKSKKLMLMASLFMACHLILTACQSTKQPTNQPKTKQTAKKATKKKQSKKVKQTRKDRKGVAGIDFPTDDGFILTKDSKSYLEQKTVLLLSIMGIRILSFMQTSRAVSLST